MDKSEKIVVLDFGGQYAHLIANRIRRLSVYSEIKDGEVNADELKDYKGIILSGGPSSVSEQASPKCDKAIFDLGIPILGICYGHQAMVHALGGEVSSGAYKEYGFATLEVLRQDGIFADLTNQEQVWMSHGDTVTKLPEGFETIGSTTKCKEAAIANFSKNFYGIQFHAEVTHTPKGMGIFSAFLDLCEVKRTWSIQNFLDEEIERIKKQVGDNKVFMMVSGGVDSTVAFVMLEKALGAENLYGLYVDTGFMRKDETTKIKNSLDALGFKNFHVYDASEEYFEALKEVYEPEEKRKIIGKLFIDIQAKVVNQLGLDPAKWILGQGTIYPDTIETGGTKHADTIKTHHNRVEQIEKMIAEGKVIEPLKELYKDEVRELGELLGVPKELVWRHPFPGPGLAVRCLANQGKADYPENYKDTELEINKLVSADGLKAKILPIKSVGVQGDGRTYRHPIVLYGAELTWKKLELLSTQITNNFSSLNRVLYSPQPELENLETKQGYLSPDRIKLLQEADAIVHDLISQAGVDSSIWQFPVVLIPVQANAKGDESIVLRPVCSQEAMTANFYNMSTELHMQMRSKLLDLIAVSSVFYDITNKPPGTIEWE